MEMVVLIALSILVGLVILVWGADTLVRGASQLAFAVGVPPLIVGLTVVAFGTSAPELAVSVNAALGGEAGVALGNVFGSNIVNVLLILGVSAIITPLAVSRQLIRVDVPIMILVTSLALFMGYDGEFTRVDGIILASGLIAYVGLQAYLGKAGEQALEELLEGEGEDPIAAAKSHWGRALIRCVVGLVMLVAGAHFLVDGAVKLATILGVSDVIIGLTIVAIGTSLPEIVTSIVASLRDQKDLAVGNVVGSNIFNLLAVLGTAATVAPAAIPVQDSLRYVDMPVTLLVAVVCLPIFVTGSTISRKEGVLLLFGYIAYLAYQIYSVVGAPAAT